MGKGKAKIEIKKIEDLQKRNICFTKRRQGLFKKAGDLCRQYPGTRVAALVFSPAGKPYIFGDPKALLGSDQEEEKGLDGNQFADLGGLDAVNTNELPGVRRKVFGSRKRESLSGFGRAGIDVDGRLFGQ
ncbi:hypothetical protein DM860_004203 [Cuscuta australis]|uniref:MADS-box domain-containing protein n=1 Tax=Cuscuta australis TaxID=267555 RepID=A0A328CY91_9ASTE|nr:hypothetical protein DM860_004203 [Cuscuta australis]